ncbi:hypothetical protein DPMN_096237 [Dreissena polymorpha]|uniref:Uncharacterized protein n=1 Tax=Dreissena polymorpha TaxID=45954 RepID=A0A9D4L922_DREPO|nr:hypothetical protein DPMN_096237 [Dreissena polymorpha]
MVFPAKVVMDGKVIEDAFPDWNQILHGNRTPVSPSALRNRKSHVQQAPDIRYKDDSPLFHSSASSTLAPNTGNAIMHKIVDPPPVRSANHVPRRSQSVSPNPSRAAVLTRSRAPISPRTPLYSQTPTNSIQRPWDNKSKKDTLSQYSNTSSVPATNMNITNHANSQSR